LDDEGVRQTSAPDLYPSRNIPRRAASGANQAPNGPGSSRRTTPRANRASIREARAGVASGELTADLGLLDPVLVFPEALTGRPGAATLALAAWCALVVDRAASEVGVGWWGQGAESDFRGLVGPRPVLLAPVDDTACAAWRSVADQDAAAEREGDGGSAVVGPAGAPLVLDALVQHDADAVPTSVGALSVLAAVVAVAAGVVALACAAALIRLVGAPRGPSQARAVATRAAAALDRAAPSIAVTLAILVAAVVIGNAFALRDVVDAWRGGPFLTACVGAGSQAVAAGIALVPWSMAAFALTSSDRPGGWAGRLRWGWIPAAAIAVLASALGGVLNLGIDAPEAALRFFLTTVACLAGVGLGWAAVRPRGVARSPDRVQRLSAAAREAQGARFLLPPVLSALGFEGSRYLATSLFLASFALLSRATLNPSRPWLALTGAVTACAWIAVLRSVLLAYAGLTESLLLNCLSYGGLRAVLCRIEQGHALRRLTVAETGAAFGPWLLERATSCGSRRRIDAGAPPLLHDVVAQICKTVRPARRAVDSSRPDDDDEAVGAVKRAGSFMSPRLTAYNDSKQATAPRSRSVTTSGSLAFRPPGMSASVSESPAIHPARKSAESAEQNLSAARGPSFNVTPVVTVLFLGLADWKRGCGADGNEATAALAVAHKLFSLLDDLMPHVGLVKYQTVGGTYIATAADVDAGAEAPGWGKAALMVGGHAVRALRAALIASSVAATVPVPCADDVPATVGVDLRIGLATGQLYSTVLGTSRGALSHIGEPINLAARMHAAARINHCRLAPTTLDSLPATLRAALTPCGPTHVKGWGTLEPMECCLTDYRIRGPASSAGELVSTLDANSLLMGSKDGEGGTPGTSGAITALLMVPSLVPASNRPGGDITRRQQTSRFSAAGSRTLLSSSASESTVHKSRGRFVSEPDISTPNSTDVVPTDADLVTFGSDARPSIVLRPLPTPNACMAISAPDMVPIEEQNGDCTGDKDVPLPVSAVSIVVEDKSDTGPTMKRPPDPGVWRSLWVRLVFGHTRPIDDQWNALMTSSIYPGAGTAFVWIVVAATLVTYLCGPWPQLFRDEYGVCAPPQLWSRSLCVLQGLNALVLLVGLVVSTVSIGRLILLQKFQWRGGMSQQLTLMERHGYLAVAAPMLLLIVSSAALYLDPLPDGLTPTRSGLFLHLFPIFLPGADAWTVLERALTQAVLVCGFVSLVLFVSPRRPFSQHRGPLRVVALVVLCAWLATLAPPAVAGDDKQCCQAVLSLLGSILGLVTGTALVRPVQVGLALDLTDIARGSDALHSGQPGSVLPPLLRPIGLRGAAVVSSLMVWCLVVALAALTAIADAPGNWPDGRDDAPRALASACLLLLVWSLVLVRASSVARWRLTSLALVESITMEGLIQFIQGREIARAQGLAGAKALMAALWRILSDAATLWKPRQRHHSAGSDVAASAASRPSMTLSVLFARLMSTGMRGQDRNLSEFPEDGGAMVTAAASGGESLSRKRATSGHVEGYTDPHAADRRSVFGTAGSRRFTGSGKAPDSTQPSGERARRPMSQSLSAIVAALITVPRPLPADVITRRRVTVISTDIVGFTSLVAPGEDHLPILLVLDAYFSRLDALLPHLGVRKAHTVGDAYVTVANWDGDYVERSADVALRAAAAFVEVANLMHLPEALGRARAKAAASRTSMTDGLADKPRALESTEPARDRGMSRMLTFRPSARPRVLGDETPSFIESSDEILPSSGVVEIPNKNSAGRGSVALVPPEAPSPSKPRRFAPQNPAVTSSDSVSAGTAPRVSDSSSSLGSLGAKKMGSSNRTPQKRGLEQDDQEGGSTHLPIPLRPTSRTSRPNVSDSGNVCTGSKQSVALSGAASHESWQSEAAFGNGRGKDDSRRRFSMDAKRQSTGDLSHLGLGGLVIRVGLATGDVHAAVLGTQFPTLTYSGAPIIRAEELESKALPGHALLDSTTTALLSSAVLGGISPSEKEGQPSTWGRKSAVHGLGGLRSAASSNQASVSSVMVDLRQRTRSGRRHLALLNYWGVESYHRRVAAALNGRGAGDDS